MVDWILAWFPLLFGTLIFGVLFTFLTVRITQALRERRFGKKQKSEPRPGGHFVFAKIKDPILPLLRGHKYEEPLDEALRSHGLGSVVGAGTQMAPDNSVAWIGLDLELYNLQEALEFARRRLRELGAPPGSVLEYRVDGNLTTLPV